MEKEDKRQQTKPIHRSNTAFCYQLGMTNILINHEIEVKILTTSTTYKVPNSPPWYKGMTSLQGAILPVVDMHFLLNIKQNGKGQSQSATKKTLLKLKHPDFPPLVIIIDGLPYQTDINEQSIHNIANTLNAYPSWIQSSTKYNNNLYLFADYKHLFTALQQNDQQQLVIPTTATLDNRKNNLQHGENPSNHPI